MTAKFTAFSITPEGNTITHRWPQAADGHLRHMQAAVGGYVEHVSLGLDDLELWVDEEGMINGALPNMLGTAVADEYFPRQVGFQGYFGPVLFTGGSDDEGNALPLSESRLIELLHHSNTVHA